MKPVRLREGEYILVLDKDGNKVDKPSPDELRMASADILIKRFKKAVMNGGIIEDYRKHEAFIPKSLRRKEKDKKAKIRRIQAEKARRNSYHYFND